MSRSNTEALADQVAAARALVKKTSSAVDVGVLLVGEHSDASTVPDLWLSGTAPERLVVDNPCSGECRARSLFEQRCLDQVRKALDDRARTMQAELDAAAQLVAKNRDRKLGGWAAKVSTAEPERGTSLVRFWRKVADLPTIRDTSSPVTVVLLSDLVETQKDHRRWLRQQKPGSNCATTSPLPDLGGIDVVLLQTVGPRDPGRWGRRWEQSLRCAGAQVDRFRWTASLPLSAYLSGQTRQTRQTGQ
jgi:hypothetical protein